MKVRLTLMFTFLVSYCIAQQRNVDSIKQNSIIINLGHNQFKDENLHPKVFRGLNMGFAYTHTKIKKNISEYSAGFNIALINTTYEKFPSAQSIMLQANYRYLLSVIVNDNMSVYVGPLTDFQYGTNAYFNWDESHLYYANYICEGIGNRINYQFGKYNLDFNLDFPVISVISRPILNRQYKIDDMTFIGIMKNLSSNPELAFPSNNFYVKTGIELHLKTKKMKNRSIGYNFQYHRMKANDGEPYQNVKQTIFFKYIF